MSTASESGGGPLSGPSLTYYGHCAFLWENEAGLRVLADPYRNISGRYWFTHLFPDVGCDLGLITHAHFDHDAAERLPEGAPVSNQQKWDTLGAERSGAGWRSGELPEGPVVASSPFGGLSLHLLPAL